MLRYIPSTLGAVIPNYFHFIRFVIIDSKYRQVPTIWRLSLNFLNKYIFWILLIYFIFFWKFALNTRLATNFFSKLHNLHCTIGKLSGNLNLSNSSDWLVIYSFFYSIQVTRSTFIVSWFQTKKIAKQCCVQ